MDATERGDPALSLKWMWGRIVGKKDPDQSTIEDTLKEIPIFQDLSRKELKRIQEDLYLRKYRPEEYVFRHSEPGLGMYIILKGSVKIYKPLDDGGAPEEPLLELSKGDFFGEMALLEEHPHTVSARARSHTELLAFFRPDLMTLVRYHPGLGAKVLLGLGRVVAQRFRGSLAHEEM